MILKVSHSASKGALPEGAPVSNTAQAILDAVGGPDNITHLTHCATRLRFELRDASVIDKDTVESIDGVLGAVPQSGDRY